MRAHVGIHAVVCFHPVAEIENCFFAGFVGVIERRYLGNLALNKSKRPITRQDRSGHRGRARVYRRCIVSVHHHAVVRVNVGGVTGRLGDVGNGFAAQHVGGHSDRVGLQITRAVHG